MEARRLAVLAIAARAATLLFLFCYFWVLAITAIDSSRFYATLPYRRFVTIALLVLVVLVPGKSWRLKFGMFLMIIAWFSILPRVSWHGTTNFFINAGTLRKGMSAEEVRRTMRPFLSVTSQDGTQVMFQPSPNSPDHCVVQLQDGKVRTVKLRHG